MPRYNGGFIGTDGLDAPDAPTIGTPSADSTEADIAFTAGTAGTTATTEFVATTNDGIGATGTSSPITITGLTNGTSYTARVYAKNSHGTSAASEASASFTPISTVVDGLFQTHLYTGNGGTQTITNNINLSGKGGLVWAKRRDSTSNSDHTLYDTARGTGTNGRLRSNNNQQAYSPTDAVTAFNNNGFSIGADASINTNTAEYVSWTFRKQPKFFDVVTYTGTGSAQNISHNLGSVPGMIIVKLINGTDSWHMYHRGVNGASSPEDWYLQLNNEDVQIDNANIWNDTAPTSSVFTVGTNGGVNGSGDSYVAYLFAHNNNDGGFGETDDQDIIKCGNYTGNNSTTGPVIDLGFEPQWVFIKHTGSQGESSFIFDNMRGVVTGGNDASLSPNAANDEQTSADMLEFNASGFQIKRANSNVNGSSKNYVYVAIRRGGTRTPTAASDVFTVVKGQAANTTSVPGFTANHVVDFAISSQTSSSSNVTGTRLLGDTFLVTEGNDAETANNVTRTKGYQNGFFFTGGGADSTRFAWMWARARGYFDVVAYSGTGSARTVGHNLGVVPEMMWIKRRDSTGSWNVYHKGLNGGTNPEQHVIYLEATEASNSGGSAVFNNTAPTSSVFTVNTNSGVNNSSGTYIAYLFATVAGVSKVGSYTGTGSSQNIDCGFTAGSSFVLVKRYDGVDGWYVADSVNGITSGQTDKISRLDNTDAQFTESDNSADYIAPHASGFNVPASSPFNGSGDDFIFYAIAAIS